MSSDRNLQKMLIFGVGIVLIIGFAGLEAISYKRYVDKSAHDIQELAEQIRGVLMATRRVYHKQFLSSGVPLTDDTLGFLPAHSLSRISKDFPNWSNYGLSFNNVSDRPRNVDNLADPIEIEAISYFRKNPAETVRFFSFQSVDGEDYYLYARPIWVEQYCLKCHGMKEDAPITIRENYDTAFNYEVGDLRGIMSIKIPHNARTNKTEHEYAIDFVIRLLTFMILFFLLSFMIRRYTGNKTNPHP